MDLMRYLEEMRRFKEEHGYYPTFRQTQRRQQEKARRLQEIERQEPMPVLRTRRKGDSPSRSVVGNGSSLTTDGGGREWP